MKRLFVDMDGTLCEFKPVAELELLYEKGYFINLQPHENVVEAIRMMCHSNQYEIFILSSVLSDSEYALDEKNKWLDRYLPEIDYAHRIYPPCGRDKKDFVRTVTEDDFLLDDYTVNLNSWCPPGGAVKLLNGINHTHKTWQGNMANYNLPPEMIVNLMEYQMGIYEPYIQVLSERDIITEVDAAGEIKIMDKSRHDGGLTVPDWSQYQQYVLDTISNSMLPEEKQALIDGVEAAKDCNYEPNPVDVSLYDMFVKQETVLRKQTVMKER